MATKASNIAQAARTVDASGNVDGDTLDNLDSSQFLRSDTNDTMTGNLDVQGTVTADGLTVDASHVAFYDNTATGNGDYRGAIGFGYGNWDGVTGYGRGVVLTSKIEGTDDDVLGLEIFVHPSIGGNDASVRSASFHYNGDISFYDTAGTTAKFFWDASAESLGIGRSSAAVRLHIGSGSESEESLTFAVAPSGEANFATNRDSAEFTWSQPSGELMRIDSSGNMLVGKTTSATSNSTGFEARQSGLTVIGRADDAPLLLNRNTSDGDIIVFRKDGTSVGSIGARVGDLYLGTGDTGITFTDSLDAIRPVNTSTEDLRDGALDIGTSSTRFKDLHLSGTVHLGSWDITEDGSGNLLFSDGGINKMRLNADGSLDVAGDINANATL